MLRFRAREKEEALRASQILRFRAREKEEALRASQILRFRAEDFSLIRGADCDTIANACFCP
ncbi:MAG: hypothetical protein JWL77_6750 [Chthonomonadaceae bacterium]|nr:hypothetical protein [Chthonomonadaceae bacterium]